MTGKSMVAAVIGGLVLAAAFPPGSAPWLAPLGIAAFVLAVGDRGVLDGAVAGFVFGLTFFGPTLWWVSPSIAPAAWAALVVAQATWLATLGAGTTLVRRLRTWPVWTAALWTAIENARSAIPWGGLPWGRLGYTAVDTPWAASLSLVGVAGTSAVVALIGAAAAGTFEAVRARRAVTLARPAIVSCLAGLGLLLAGMAWVPDGRADIAGNRPRLASVAVVQAEVPGDGTDVAAHHREITSTLLRETRQLATLPGGAVSRPDLVVWPENATAVDPATDAAAEEALQAAVEVAGAPVLAGSITDGPTSSSALNQGIVWGDAGPQARYTKQHLVPFGEYVPLRWMAERISARVADIQRDMIPGEPASPIGVEGLLLANALCFDVAYDDVLREQVAQGAELAVVQTSNAMFLGTAQQDQQWMVTRARAIELGRSIIVSSINGVSGVIAPDGTVIARLPTTRAGSAIVDVPVATGTTLAVRLGAWPARTGYAMGLAGVLIAGYGARRRERRPDLATRPEAVVGHGS